MIFSNRSAASLRALVAVMAAGLALAIAGCEAGAAAPTQHWHPPTAGASTIVDNVIRVNNVFVLGAPPAVRLPAGSSAGLFLALANSGAPDRLVAITAPGSAAAVQMPAGGFRLGSQQSVLLTGPTPQVILRGLTRPLNGGQSVLVVLHFLHAGRVPMAVPVMPRSQWALTFAPAPPLVTPSPPASGSPGKASPSPAVTPSPTPSPSPTG